MKPARGSGRASTRGPNGAGRGDRRTQQEVAQKPGSSVGRSQAQLPRRRGAAVPRKVKGQEKWKPMSKSSIMALDNMLSLSVLSILTLKRKEKEESQKHLNILKDRFLTHCARLAVPTRKHGDMVQASRQHQTESKKTELGEKRLQTLKENLSSVVHTLEEMEVKMDRLGEDCRIMRIKLEEEEENAREILQLKDQAILHLPALAPRAQTDLPLQEQIIRMVPNPSAVAMVLQNMPESQGVRAFLELAHRQADWLLAPPTTPGLDGVTER